MRITAGRILAQRFFDVAYEIDLRRAQLLAMGLSRRADFAGSAGHVWLADPPLEMALLPRACGILDVAPCEVGIRIYRVGTVAVSFALELPVPLTPEELIAYGARVLEAQEQITLAARSIVQEIMPALAPACKPGDFSEFVEDYTLFCLRRTEPKVTAAELAQHLDLARLLLGEVLPLAPSERSPLSRPAFSYYEDELVVLDWNSALVLDPRATSHVLDLLELASVQLLGVRAYAHLVGRALDRLYDELEPAGRSTLFAAARYQRLSRSIMRTYVDMTEMTERIDNSLQFLGDTWLARVHRAALEQFDVPRWQRQLRNKLDVLQKINQHLVDQITTRRAMSVEIAITLLITLEIILALLKIT